MPNNGNGWNRNRESSGNDWNDNENRYDQNRGSDYDNDDRRRNENYSNQARNYGSGSGYNSNPNTGYERSSGDKNYGDRYGNYRGSGNYGAGSTDWNRNNDSNRSNDWNSRRGYTGSDYDRNNDRYNYESNQGHDRNWWDKTKDEVSSWFGDDDAERRRRMDAMRGEHRGKGPKGYTRSDDRIKEDVNDNLSDDPHIDASDIDVAVSSCEVTLTGTVSNRWQKRHAEDIAERVSGVKNVENRIRVSSSATQGTSSYTPGSPSATAGSSSTMPGTSVNTGTNLASTSKAGTNGALSGK